MIDNSKSIKERDLASKARVSAGQKKRDNREAAKNLKAQYKERLQSANSTTERRDAKEQFKSDLMDIDTGLESNRSGAGSTVQDDGIDNIDSSTEGGGGEGGGLPDGTDENDLLYWDGNGWVAFAAPATTGTFVLGVVAGSMTWITGEEC